jgi:hypothetical protein
MTSSALRRTASTLLMLAAHALVTTSLQSQTPIEHELFPGRTYDAAVPLPGRTLGYVLGKDLATYEKMQSYFDRLATASKRAVVGRHGESYEGRPIFNITISSPENLARIDTIRSSLARLADPRTVSSQEIESIVRNTPLVVMLVFATDGAETAAPEAAIQVAYQLAAGTDARTLALLRDAVVIIVPAENPDANQRAVAWYKAFRVGPNGTSDPDAAEHNFPWGINSNNHYQVDPNRESVWSTLRETRAMVALYRRWNPQVFVDNHGEHAQYTGPWYVEPLHEVLTQKQQEWHRRFGEAMLPEFAKRGYVYHPWEFGQFDPGYWDTYPNFSGAIAWTTETTGGGSRGLRIDRRNGAPYTLADGIIQHVLAADITLGLAAQNRERLLRDFVDYKRSAIEEGLRGPIKAYAISSSNDPRSLATVVNTMRRNAIEVHRLTRPLPVRGARAYFSSASTDNSNSNSNSNSNVGLELPVGSYIFSLAQPEARMLKVLMEPEARFSPAFLAQIARAQADTGRAASRLFYDVTAWSMPHTYNLEAYELTEAVPAAASSLVNEDVRLRGDVINPNAQHGFLIDYSSNSAVHAIARLRRDSIAYRVAREPFITDGRRFRAGTVVMLRGDNPRRDLAAVARTLATESGITVVGVSTAATESGLRLNAENLPARANGRIAVVMDRPVSPASYGHIWYSFEQLYGLEFTALSFDRLASVNLDKYNVVILPDGNYGSVHRAITGDVTAKLRAWVEKGGTLIGIRGASAWIANEERGLTAARVRPAAPRTPAIPGTVFRATIPDARDPLVYGYDGELPVMIFSALAFDAPASVQTPVRIAEANRARVSGFVFPESLTRVAGSPYLMRERRGQGSVVLFLDDPLFRLYWDGLARLFFNAVFLADG